MCFVAVQHSHVTVGYKKVPCHPVRQNPRGNYWVPSFATHLQIVLANSFLLLKHFETDWWFYLSGICNWRNASKIKYLGLRWPLTASALRKQLWNKFITGRRFLLHTLRESQCAGQIMRHSTARQLRNYLHQGRRRRQTSNTYKASRALGMQIHGSGRRNTCNATSAGKGGRVSQETVRAYEQRQVFMVHSAATLGRKAALSASWRAGASQQARGYSSLSNKKEACGTSRKAEAEPGQTN